MFPARRTSESRRQNAGRSFASITWVCPSVLPATRRAVGGNRSRTGAGCVRNQTHTTKETPKENPDNAAGFRHNFARAMVVSRFMQRLGLWQGPILRLLVSFGVAVERALEISQCDHEP